MVDRVVGRGGWSVVDRLVGRGQVKNKKKTRSPIQRFKDDHQVSVKTVNTVFGSRLKIT